MDHPQAQYGNDGSSTARGAPEVHDPFDPNASDDGRDAHPSPNRFGGSDYGSPHGSPSASEYNDSPYFDEDGHPAMPEGGFEREAGDRSSSYANFLASANKQIAKQSGNTRDPFFQANNGSRSSLALDDGGALTAPSRPFTMHSRVSSHSSISSIVDEHGSSSPLNKAMETFTDANGEVAQDFVQKLKNLNSDNSKGDLCIEKYLEKAEKAHFVVLKKEKIESSKASGFGGSVAPSIYTQEDDVGPILALFSL